MSKDLVAIVDENDTILEIKPRDELTKKDIIRVSVLWVENEKGESLMQQRSFTKAIDPGQWGPAVAGTVESHETYLTNIIKEAEEEIGLVDFEPIEVGKRMFWAPNNGFGRIFTFYKTIIKHRNVNEFKLEVGEVEQIQWVPKETVFKEIHNNPTKYVPSAIFYQELYS
jgi:isopentenyldiphosphate isomerase